MKKRADPPSFFELASIWATKLSMAKTSTATASMLPPGWRRSPHPISARNWRGNMEKLSLANPVFATYVIAASIMILKAVSMSWLTVLRMMQEKGGFRSPEDIRKTSLNPEPNPKQLEPNERVERIRRIQLNDLESLPFFLIAGLLFVLTEPSLMLTRLLLYGYVLSRLLHFGAYFTARTYDTRATLWTVGSLILVFMTCWSLVFAMMQA